MELRRMGVSDRLMRILFSYVLIVVERQTTLYLTLREIYNFAQLTPVHYNFKIFRALPTSLLLVLITFIGDTNPTFAQTRIANCQPPNAGEYLLLVIAPTNNDQRQLRFALPSEFKTVTCKYNNQTVVRMGGFKKIDDANRWSQYVKNIVGLSVIITTPSTQAQPAKPSVVSTLESGEINKIAKQITVRIGGANQGTGVIINKQGNTYTVLTNRHLVQIPENYTLRTSDGQTYAFNSSQVKQLPNLDLAVLQFNSDKNYSYAKLGDSSKLTLQTPIYIGGWSSLNDPICLEPCYRFNEGEIVSFLPNSKDGYSLIYSNPVKQGMSGGPVLNAQGELVGINGTDPESGVSDFAGIPINEYTKYQNIITASEPTPIPIPAPSPTPRQSLMAVASIPQQVVRDIADKITVRIDGAKGGSGIIIRSDGNTYTVLTCWHVVDKKGNYTVRTGNGKTYQVNYSTVKRIGKIDLAEFQFTSNENYRPVEIGNSSQVSAGSKVYAFGWAAPDQVSKGREYVPLETTARIVSQPVDEYALVLSNTIKPGMSGGPILDEQGRLIGVSGQARTDERILTTDFLGIPIDIYKQVAANVKNRN